MQIFKMHEHFFLSPNVEVYFILCAPLLGISHMNTNIIYICSCSLQHRFKNLIELLVVVAFSEAQEREWRDCFNNYLS